MSVIAEWLRRVWYLLNRRRLDAALREEMEAHRAAMNQPARFGNALRLREESQDVWGWRWLERLVRDLGLSVRTLRRSPLFTIVTTSILAIGVGVNLAFFQVVNATLLQPYPVRDPGTLASFVRVCCWGESTSSMTTTVPVPMAGALAGNGSVLSAVLLKRPADVGWGADGVERVRAAFVSSNWFDELGGEAAIGRVFHRGITPAAPDLPVAVLSYDAWQRRLGGRRDVVGQLVHINDRLVTIIGVANDEFADVDLPVPAVWLPIEHVDAFFNPGSRFVSDWRSGGLVIGRFAAGLSAPAVVAGIRSTLEGLARERPADVKSGEWLQPRLASERFMEPAERAQALNIVLAAGMLTGLVLLVAALNLGNLMLARATGRVREMTIRSALGASRWHVMRHLAFEGVQIAVAGGLVGLGLGMVVAQVFVNIDAIPRGTDLTPDWRTAVVLLGIIAGVALVVSLPAAWRVGRRDLSAAVRDGGERTTAGLHASGLRSLLVGLQLAGCAVLLVVAGQVLNGLTRLTTASLGFDFENVAVLEPQLAEYDMTPAAATRYWLELKERIRRHPDVESVSMATHAPLGLGGSTSSYAAISHLTINTLDVEPEFFSVMRIPILFGRSFGPGDVPGEVTVLSERVAREMYGRANVVGELFPKGQQGRRIVGVAADAHLFTPHATDVGERYGFIDPASGNASYAVLVARGRADVSSLPPALRDASRLAAPHVVPATRLLRDNFAARTSGPRLASAVGVMTALTALALASVGIAGVVAYAGGRRYKEIGIRMALGAQQMSIIRTLTSRLAVVSALGASAGLGGGWMAGRLLSGRPLYLEPLDVLPYGGAVFVLLISTGVAALWPAIRLLRTDPLKALRVD